MSASTRYGKSPDFIYRHYRVHNICIYTNICIQNDDDDDVDVDVDVVALAPSRAGARTHTSQRRSRRWDCLNLNRRSLGR